MASNRHLGRIVALQTLYEQDFRREANDVTFKLDEVLDRNVNRYRDTIDDVEFIKKLVNGVSDKQIEFKIVGKNGNSSGFTQCIDSITLTPL